MKGERLYPEFFVDHVGIFVVDDVDVSIVFHHGDFIDDQFFLRLIGEIHLFDRHFFTSGQLVG